MRILQLHSDFIAFKPIKKEIKLAEETERKERKIEQVVVLFVAIEKDDNSKLIDQAIEELKDFLKKLKVNRILIYPFAHLSNNLSKPSIALKLLKTMEEKARNKQIETFRAPFGWTKQFTISIKGHPLAEQSRAYIKSEKIEQKTQEVVSKALKAERKLRSFWHILEPDGKLRPIDEFKFKGYKNLELFSKYEITKARASCEMPPHVTLMKRLEIADYEEGSDPGNIRWYPKGRLIKSLLEQFVTNKMIDYGAMEVETPIMYDFKHPSLSDYLNRFPARQYLLKSDDKELFLRFSACFGQFLMMHDTQFSYKQMPLKLYELTRYSFRREKSGEVCGLRRLRGFTMPDCHAFCTDLDQAKDEFEKRFKLSIEILNEIELTKEDYEIALRFTEDFYEENKNFIKKIAKIYSKPILVELWKDRFFYFALKWDANFIDNQKKAAALSTDQIDVENAKRYKITYVDSKGEKKYPLILHFSPSGAIERVVYALLEKAYKNQQKGKSPMLPVWLSPTQVRLIPISEGYLEKVTEISKKIANHNIRVDIDDRASTLQKKVRDAEKEWVPYIIVIGPKEIESGVLSVRNRKNNRKVENIELSHLIEKIQSEIKNKPYKGLALPRKLSHRPQFYG